MVGSTRSCPSTADGQGFQTVRTVQQPIKVYQLYIAEFAPTLAADVGFLFVVHYSTSK